MKTFKRSFGLFLVLALVSTACGGSDDDGASSSASSSAAVATTAAPAATTAAPSVVETPEEEAVALPDLGGRTVSVAIENAYLPYNYVDAETGDIGGFDYDFFGEICNRLNCELDYVEFAWEATIQSVGDGTFDTAGGGITITAEREETLDFTDSYISVDQRLIVGLGEDRFASLEEFGQMDELTVCSQTGTTNAETAIANFGEDRVILFETFGFAVQALLSGDCDSVIMDETAGQGYQGENADSLELLEGVLSADELGVPFPNGSDLVAPFNAAISSMKADGSLFELGSKYFTDAFTVTYDDIGDGAYAEEEVAPVAADGMCVGLVTDVGQVDDKSFNQSAWEGVQKAADEMGADVDYIETQAAKDYATNIGLFAESGCDVIVTVGFALGEATAIAAAEYPDVDFIGVDQFQGAAVDGVAGLIFPEDQAGFLAGALAASMSQSGIIAEVLGTDLVPPVVAFGEGYVNGAKYVNPSIKVIKTYHPGGLDTAFTDPEWGATTARQALENGADVVFGAGGKTGNGALIEVAGEEGALCIGVDTDQWDTVPEAQPCLITSSMKMIVAGVFDLISQSAAGSMPSGNYGGAVGLAPFHDFDSMVSDDIKSMLTTLKADLESGALSACVWDADSNPDCAGPEPLTASWRGVTEEAIHIGVSMLDFGFLKDVNLSPQGWGDQQLVWETLVANLNSNGGILGRELVVDAYKYYSPIGPILGGIDPEAVCLELAADIETFAVLGGFLGPVEDINTCITGTENTIMVGGRQTAERLEASSAPWIEPGTMKETKMKAFLSLLEQEGMLDGKSIALVGNEDDGPYSLASSVLSDMDVNVVLDVGLQIPVGDTAAEDSRWDVLVQNVLASGADVAMLVGGERAGIRNLAFNDIDMDLYIMNSETFTNLSESVTPDMADGGVTLTGLTEQEMWDDPLTQAECVVPFKDANPDLLIEGPDQFDEGEEEWYRSIMSYCRWLKLFVMITEAAGADLTHETFLAAAESMTDFVLPGQPHNSIGPGKYDASDAFRLSVFDANSGGDQGELVALTGVLDGTP